MFCNECKCHGYQFFKQSKTTAKKIPKSCGARRQTCFTPFMAETGSARVTIIGDQSVHKRPSKDYKMGRTTQLCKIDETLIVV